MCAKKYDEFAKRMKEYEHETRVFLEPAQPVMIRVDENTPIFAKEKEYIEQYI
jgi:hypothetical protein